MTGLVHTLTLRWADKYRSITLIQHLAFPILKTMPYGSKSRVKLY